jgi:hypothetical protein
MAEKKAFCESERLRSGEKQFFRLLNFFLPLRLDFVHKNFAAENGGSRTVAMRPRMSTHASI